MGCKTGRDIEHGPFAWIENRMSLPNKPGILKTKRLGHQEQNAENKSGHLSIVSGSRLMITVIGRSVEE